MSVPVQNSPSKWMILLIFIIPILSMALGVGTTILFHIQQTNLSNLIVNLFFLVGCILLFLLMNTSREDVGLKVIQKRVKTHILLSLAVFSLYILFYVFAIRISAIKSFTPSIAWGLGTTAVVVVTEELYFRGILYRFLEKRFSSTTALIVSAAIFGLFHVQQGFRGIISKSLTGWLWGSIRYSTGMTFLLIFPIHFTYNSIWLLFEGNWNNPPTWAIYGLPVIEFLLGMAIVIYHRKNYGSSDLSV